MSLFLPNLQLAFLKDFKDDVVYEYLGTKRFLEIRIWGCLAFADIGKNGWNLEDIVEVCLYARAVFEDFVLVAGYLETLFAYRLVI